MKNYLISIQKNEHPYIQEWFEHHKQFEFNKIIVFNNSNTPYNITDPLYQEINVSTMEAPQPVCYQWFYDTQMQDGDTATILDGDEFLESDFTISELWNKFNNAQCLRFSWQIFGDNGLEHYEDKPVQERFTEPAPMNAVYNDELPSGITENWHTKYSIKKQGPAKLLVHNAICEGMTVNMNNEQVNQYSPWIEPIWHTAFVKHYLTKSLAEFCERRLNKSNDATGGHISNDKVIRFYKNLNGREPI